MYVNDDNFRPRLSWSIFSHFVATRNSLSKCAPKLKIAKNITKTRYFGDSRSFKVIDFGSTEKLVTSVCYFKQKSVPIMQPFLR